MTEGSALETRTFRMNNTRRPSGKGGEVEPDLMVNLFAACLRSRSDTDTRALVSR